MFRILLPVLILTLLAPYVSKDVYAAQDTIRGTSAASLPHPELAPMGIHADGYLLFPSLGYTGTFDDNVFATESDKKSSYLSELPPSIAARSDWNNHALYSP